MREGLAEGEGVRDDWRLDIVEVRWEIWEGRVDSWEVCSWIDS